MNLARATLSLLSVAASLAASPRAEAQTPGGDSVIDRRFQEALDALDAGRWEEACPKFREVLAAEATVAVLFKVAKCSEHEGKIAQAWSETRDGLRLNARVSDGDRKAMLEEYGQTMLRQIEPRLSRLAVTIEGAPPTVDVLVKADGRALAPSELAEALVVERGRHELTAEAQGFERATEAVELAEGETKSVVVHLRRVPPPPSRPPESRGASPLVVLGGVVGAIGVSSIGVAIGAGVRALDLGSALTERCPDPKACDATGLDLAHDGALFAPLSTAFFVVGGTLSAASIPLLVVGARARSTPAEGAVRASLRPLPGGAALTIGGAL
ncbi:MAG: hypothetical protein U0414_04280 [Polyangiaceae bacterium]